MDEATKQMILQQLTQQGLLGGGIADLQPIWQKQFINAQIEGPQNFPQYPEWYKMVQDMLRQGAATPGFGGLEPPMSGPSLMR